MHIVVTKIRDTFYCYAAECKWNPNEQKYEKPSKAIGKLDAEGHFVPNRYLSALLAREGNSDGSISEQERCVIDTAKKKFGEGIKPQGPTGRNTREADRATQTATVIHCGPKLVFGGISSRYRILSMLATAFGKDAAQDILSLAWYVASEGKALSNNDSWLDYYENPKGRGLSSQEVSKLLDLMDHDGIMTFFKLWLKGFTNAGKVLYDLTSISYYGKGVLSAEWGYNRDHENLPQINYALLCVRDTGMPLFAWPLSGSISDVSTLENTLELISKLGYKPDCLMMDRGFACKKNIGYMLHRGYTFLQAINVNARWAYDIIDMGELARYRPDAMLQTEDRTYYVSTTNLRWVRCRKHKGDKDVEETFFYQCKFKGDHYIANGGENIEVLEERLCQAHVLFCQDLVGNSWDRFMSDLNKEHKRLISDPPAAPKHEFAPYFLITKPKHARRRIVEFNMQAIISHKNKYAGHVCFITNDATIRTAEDALNEYSTRDYIEKDFDEMKGDLDMDRIRVQTDDRMRARLFIQFLAEVFLRDVLLAIRKSKDCNKLTRTQVFSHIKTISKIHFQGKYNDVTPQLSKKQRCILEALGVKA